MSISAAIISAIATGAGAMSIANGYNFNYGPVDVFDPAARVYPQIFLEFPDETQDGTQMAGKLTYSKPLTFRTLIAKGSGDIDVEVAKVFDDIKKMMEALSPSLQALGLLYLEPVEASWEPLLVQAIPAQLKLTIRLTYRQSRANPASP